MLSMHFVLFFSFLRIFPFYIIFFLYVAQRFNLFNYNFCKFIVFSLQNKSALCFRSFDLSLVDLFCSNILLRYLVCILNN